MRQNEIRISMEIISQTDKYFEPRYFVDEIAWDLNGNSCANNIGSYKTQREANLKALEISKKFGIKWENSTYV